MQGQSARRLSSQLSGKTLRDVTALLDAESRAGTCVRTEGTLPDGHPQISYRYPDGTQIRVKPQGGAYAHRATYSVEVTKQAQGPAVLQDDVAFKVAADGKAVPKGPDDVKNPYDKSTNKQQYAAYVDEVMKMGHLETAPEPRPGSGE